MPLPHRCSERHWSEPRSRLPPATARAARRCRRTFPARRSASRFARSARHCALLLLGFCFRGCGQSCPCAVDCLCSTRRATAELLNARALSKSVVERRVLRNQLNYSYSRVGPRQSSVPAHSVRTMVRVGCIAALQCPPLPPLLLEMGEGRGRGSYVGRGEARRTWCGWNASLS